MNVIKKVNATELDASLSALADAIRSKTGGTTPLSFPDGMTAAIEAITSADGLVDTSDATATAADIVLGKTAYVNGVKLVGTYDPNSPVPEFGVNGVWLFNSTVELFEPTQYVNFTSNGTAFSAISRYPISPKVRAFAPDPVEETFMLYYDATEAYSSVQYWRAAEFRTVDFGSTLQEVDEVFYNWLHANATKQ